MIFVGMAGLKIVLHGANKWAELLDSASWFLCVEFWSIKTEVEAKGAVQILVFLDLPMNTIFFGFYLYSQLTFCKPETLDYKK